MHVYFFILLLRVSAATASRHQRAELRNATISFVMSVRPSVLPSVNTEQLDSHWTDFDEI